MELLGFIFLFAAFLLFNFVSTQARRRRLERQRRALESFAQAPPAPEAGSFGRPDPFNPAWGRAPETAVLEVAPGFNEERIAAIAAAAPRAARPPRPAVKLQRRPRHFLRTRQDLRHAVMAMTVLGPCRALQPYDPDASGGGNAPRRG